MEVGLRTRRQQQGRKPLGAVEVGAAIAVAREARGWGRGDLALRANVSTHSVARWERGETVPTALDLKALARVLEVSMEELLAEVPVQVWGPLVAA